MKGIGKVGVFLLIVSIGGGVAAVLIPKSKQLTADPRPPPDSQETALLESIQTGVHESLQQAESLEFTAELTMWAKGEDETRYRAQVEMRPGQVKTSVYDLGILVAEIERRIAPDGIRTTEFRRDREVKGCLFGTLQESWIGQDDTGQPQFGHGSIKKGRLIGVTERNGESCYEIQFELLFFEYEVLRGKVVETYYVVADNFRLAEWDSVNFAAGETEPVKTVTRKYFPLTSPTVLSAKTETEGAQR
ncbi:MAG: hypothetical protein HYT46_02945 [Candidatus Vogelbacteria bacterium]|nr:hypothetical protein [Candidatus Vogelbacteria bacterium]